MAEGTTIQDLTEKGLEPFSLAIGKLCNEWAHLESAVGRLFLMIGGWDYRLPAAQSMTSCLSMRDKLSAIKVGALCLGLREDILDTITSSVDYIDNQLRNARNRYVHDIWATAGDGVSAFRFEITPREKKRQQGMPRLLQLAMHKRVSIDEVNEVVFDISKERDHIMDLVKMASRPTDYVFPTPPVALPQRLHLRRLQEMQRLKDSVDSTQKRPPKPSAASRRKPAKPKDDVP